MTVNKRKFGVLIGGSGLIGGAITHYFKTRVGDAYELLAPNSKKLSLRVPEDIQRYFLNHRPDFIINAAIATIDSNPQLAYETNYLGALYLARAAQALKIPYIHLSSAAVMPSGENLTEEDTLPLASKMGNYSKSKLMAEMSVQHLGKTLGLDYTIIRLGVVYGKHDHKIQGLHRLFFSVVDQAMPVMLTRKGVMHSYSHAKKLPPFIHHILEHREEFGGQIYNFVDRNPVELASFILTIRQYMELKLPKEIYVPYRIAQTVQVAAKRFLKVLKRCGIEARLPAELLFMENFYRSQTLSSAKLEASSFQDPAPDMTAYSYLPDMIEYYVTRWEHLNLIDPYNLEFFDPKRRAEEFLNNPDQLLDTLHRESTEPFLET